MADYRLSPSDLTYLYDGCKHCFALKVKFGIQQPSIGLPAVFSTIANLQKDYYSGKRTETFCPALPPGVVRYGEKKVRSERVAFDGSPSTCYIQGRFDIVVEFDDGTYGVLDFKTASPTEEKSELYGRQLHAYTMALERPEGNSLHLSPVSRLGLLYFVPDRCEHMVEGRQRLEGRMDWVEVNRNDDAFRKFLAGVVGLLDGPLPPPDPGSCDWCAYRVKMRDGTQTIEETVPTCPVCGSPMRRRSGKFGEFWSCTQFPKCKGTRN